MNDDVERCRLQLERAVREANYPLSGDNRVSEQVAARLLAVSVRHLRRLRCHGVVAGHRLGVGGSTRVSYRLDVLAEFIVSTSDEHELA